MYKRCLSDENIANSKLQSELQLQSKLDQTNNLCKVCILIFRLPLLLEPSYTSPTFIVSNVFFFKILTKFFLFLHFRSWYKGVS